MADWYYKKTLLIIQTIGPVSSLTLLGRIERGELKPGTEVMSPTHNNGNWFQIKRCPKMMEAYNTGCKKRAAEEDERREKEAAERKQLEKEAAERKRQRRREAAEESNRRAREVAREKRRRKKEAAETHELITQQREIPAYVPVPVYTQPAYTPPAAIINVNQSTSPFGCHHKGKWLHCEHCGHKTYHVWVERGSHLTKDPGASIIAMGLLGAVAAGLTMVCLPAAIGIGALAVAGPLTEADVHYCQACGTKKVV